MTSTPPIPKADRPSAIEALLRSHRAENPGTWPKYQDVLSTVGGSERDFAPLIRAIKDKIASEELALVQLPDLPEDLRHAAERFVTDCWRQATTLADANAAEVQRARQADRLAVDEERRELDAMVGRLADERDAERDRAEEAEGREKSLQDALNEERAAREKAETRLEELRGLFMSIGFPPPTDLSAGELGPDVPGTIARGRKTTSSASPASTGAEDPELPLE